MTLADQRRAMAIYIWHNRIKIVGFFILTITSLFILNIPARAQQASQQDFADCQQSANVDRSIAGCSRIANDLTQSPADRARAWHLIGNAKVASDALDQAIHDFGEAINLDPNNAAIDYASRAIAELRKADRSAAIADYRKAVAIDSAKIASMAIASDELKEIANAAATAPANVVNAAPPPPVQEKLERAPSAPTPAKASSNRFALVIGNAKYPDADAPLPKAVNDARAIANRLESDGFNVDLQENLKGKDIRSALDQFYKQLQSGSVALIFYSGFGVQSNRHSYMIPVDAQIWTEADVRRDGISLESVLNEINNRGANVKIALIDAGERNPYERRFRTFSAGLAPVIAPNGSLVMYSTALSSVINKDSDGEHSLFVEELLKEIQISNLPAEEALNRTRVGVTRASRGDQIPWISSSLAEDFSFAQR